MKSPLANYLAIAVSRKLSIGWAGILSLGLPGEMAVYFLHGLQADRVALQSRICPPIGLACNIQLVLTPEQN